MPTETALATVAPSRKFHFDRRADELAAKIGEKPDELISTKQLAAETGTSTQFWEILRSRGGGPRFCSLGPRRIRYPRSALRQFFEERLVASTAEYVVPGQGRKRGSRVVDGRVVEPVEGGDAA